MIISGFNFFAFAMLGEYVLRILQLGSATPQYIVREIARHGDEAGKSCNRDGESRIPSMLGNLGEDEIPVHHPPV